MARRSANRTDVTLDKVGRVVIPEAVRRRLGMGPGSKLTVSVEGDRLILQPIDERDAIVDRDGILVATGALVGPLVDHRDVREERTRKLSRW